MIFDKKKSMRRKLVLMFVVTTIASHVILGIFAQCAIESYFHDVGVQVLKNRFSAIKNNPARIEAAPRTIDSYNRHVSKYWRVKDKKVVMQNSITLLPEDKLEYLLDNKGGDYSQYWEDKDGYYLATSFALDDETTLIMGVDVNHHIEFFEAVSRMMIWFTIIASVLAGFYSVIIVNNGLKPLRKFEEYLARVRPGNLDIRIPVEKLPVELEALGQVQNSMLDRMDVGFQRLSGFSADIAHELRTPLTNMTTQTQVMLSQERSVDEYCDVLGSNLEELERISKIINDTLYLAQAENSLLYQNQEVLCLKSILKQMCDYHSILAEDKGVTIELEGEGELYVDKLMFQRAVDNLLSNAIRHAVDSSVIKVIVKHGSENLSISILNQGETISEESLPFIFDSFYRGDSARDRDCGKGAGLGLAITRSIVDTYNGNISVESKEGLTKFEMQFPAVCKL